VSKAADITQAGGLNPPLPRAPGWLGRLRGREASAAPVARPRDEIGRVGALPCTDGGCPSHSALACEYTDRRGRTCSTAWCDRHRQVVESQVFCRRHAGIMRALAVRQDSQLTRPDLDNRAPSLVNWVAREIDDEVRALLAPYAEPGTEPRSDPVRLLFLGLQRDRAWEWSWKVTDRNQDSYRLGIMVTEADDSVVCVKVGGEAVARGMPPWIRHRMQRESVTPAVDADERAAFRQRILSTFSSWLETEARRFAADNEVRRLGQSPMLPGYHSASGSRPPAQRT
jgi:hypothetical protein